MSATDFLPRRESDLRSFSVNFNSKINATPEAFGLTPGLAAEYNVLHNNFMALYALANSPSGNSSSTLTAKRTATRALRDRARRLARLIRAHPGITSEQKISLGLTVRGRGGKQRPCPRPRKAPIMWARQTGGNEVTIRLRGADSPSRTARPKGVEGALVMTFVGEHPPADPKMWSFLRNVTRTTLKVSLPGDVLPGTKVWFAAAWQNPRGHLGPFAQPVCVHKQFGFVAGSQSRLAA